MANTLNTYQIYAGLSGGEPSLSDGAGPLTDNGTILIYGSKFTITQATGAFTADDGDISSDGSGNIVANSFTGALSGNISQFTNNIGYLTSAAQPGNNVSEFVNDAGYVQNGADISTFTNDAGYLTSAAQPGDNVSEFANNANYIATADNANLTSLIASSSVTAGSFLDGAGFSTSGGAVTATSFSGSGSGLTGTASSLTAGHVTTNANLTGPITSTGNATAVAAQTGTGTTFVMQASPTLTTPAIGAATGTSLVLSPAAATVPLRINANASQSADLFDIYDHTGAKALSFTDSGAFLAVGNVTIAGNNGAIQIGSGGYLTAPSQGPCTIYSPVAVPQSASNVSLVVTSAGSQVGNLTNWTNSSNAVLSFINATGAFSGPVLGVAGATNAAAGNIGEYITSTVAVGSAVSLVSGTAKTVTSISLTAGDWDVWGVVDFHPGTLTTGSYFQASISATTNALGAQDQFASAPMALAAGLGIDVALPTPQARISLATTTTIYLVGVSGFATSTMTAYGSIFARRRQ